MAEEQTGVIHSLLIVDDRADVLRALQRYFELEFDAVWTAQTPAQAESILSQYAPRYLLSDYWLGEESPPTTELIPRWRQEYRSLHRVALMTGTQTSSLNIGPEVEKLFLKPPNIQQVVRFFLT